ncbi:MAG: hypothetical protein Q9M40_07205 [Sulfurimonas sp.]|nr:hypothetical protein [Sulfurimonas sp.]
MNRILLGIAGVLLLSSVLFADEYVKYETCHDIFEEIKILEKIQIERDAGNYEMLQYLMTGLSGHITSANMNNHTGIRKKRRTLRELRKELKTCSPY